MRDVIRWLSVLVCAAILAVGCSSDPPDENADDAARSSAPTTAEPVVDDSTPGESDVVDLDDGRPTFTAPEEDPTLLELADDIRTGVLDNGLTYLVQSNDQPGNSVSIRLAVKAGAYHEDPVGLGTAHFLEHMVFNGTDEFPGNEMNALLRSIGAEIGADFNAYTSPTETVYIFGVEDRGDAVDTAIRALSQMASAATLDPDEVSSEAPIIREELRLFDEAGDGAVNARFEETYYDGTPFEDVSVDGSVDTIAGMTQDTLRAFYDTWYRPDNMAVVIVGDRGLDNLEELVIDNFSDLEARGSALDPAIPNHEPRTEPLVDVVIAPEFGDSFISVDVPFPPRDLGTVGGNRLWLTDIILSFMIESRLAEGVQTGRLDLRRAGGGWFPYTRGLQYMGFNVDADDLELGTEVFMTEIEATIREGFTQQELDRAIDTWRSIQDQELLRKNDISDNERADGLVEYFLGGTDLQSTEDSVEMHLEFLDSMSLAEVNNHWGWNMTASAPLVLVVGPDEERVGEPSNHLAALQRARLADVAGFEDTIVEIDLLMERPDEVREVQRHGLDQNSGFELEFENGMRVLFSSSDIVENHISVETESPGGRSQLDEFDSALSGLAVSAVDASGAGPYSAIQVSRYLSDLDVGMASYVGDFSEGFVGGAATEDLEVFFQLVHLAVTAPVIEPIPFAQQLEFARDGIDFAELDSGQAAEVALYEARSGGGNFVFQPTNDQLDEATPELLSAIYTDRFSSLDDHVVVIVGDVDDDTIVDLARAYIGSLPIPNADDAAGFYPDPGLVNVETDAGSGTASGAYRFSSVGRADETINNRVLAEVADSYLTDRGSTVIREELGATYGGYAFVSFNEPGDGADLNVVIDGDPSRIDEIAEVVEAELDSAAAGSIDQADFDEAIAVIRSRYNFIGNNFITVSLFDEAYNDGGSRVINRNSQIAALDRIRPADLAAFVDGLLSDTNRIDVRNVP